MEQTPLQTQSIQSFKADLFKALAHPTRIRILELLRPGELTVTDLQAKLKIDSSSVSQQLGVLRAKSIVEGRKDGTSVYYRIREKKICELLDIAREVFTNHLGELQAMAEEDRALSIGHPARSGNAAHPGGQTV